MLYRTLGNTGESVSVLGFGCMRLPLLPGGDPGRIDEAEATRLLRFAIDQGVNYVDTAYPYHGPGMAHSGASEPFLGRALKDGYRARIKLATKLPSWLVNSRSDMDRYLDEQLKRLDTDHIDFYLAHTLGKDSWPRIADLGVGAFMDQAIRDGRVKHAGFSFHGPLPLFKEIVDGYAWSFCQIQFNYLDEYFQAGVEGLEYAASRGLGLVIMEPLRGGKLAGKLPGEAQALLDAAPVKRSSAAWGLRWVWNRPEVSVVLSGMSAMPQVEENLATAAEALPSSLTPAELALLDKVKQEIKNRTKVNCTGCSYCMPCPAGVNIPGCFSYYNDYHLFSQDDARTMYALRVDKQKASLCVECGACEKHCPQGLAVPGILKEVAALFD